MKSLLLFIVPLLVVSCSDSENEEQQIKSRYILIKAYTSQSNQSPLTNENLPFDEEIVLYNDGTFRKKRQHNGSVISTGTYSWEDIENDKYLILTYYADNSIIYSCSSDLKESLKKNTDKSLINTSFSCDLYGLEYEKQ